jgi:hypothetical protein
MTADIEEMLTEGLAEYAQAITAPDDLLHAARARRRHRVARRACLAGGTALAVSIATVLAVSSGKPQPQMTTDAYVVGKVQAAITAAGANHGLVMRSVTSNPATGKTVRWSYQDQVLAQWYGTHETAQEDSSYVVSARLLSLTGVNYADQTWSTDQWRIDPGNQVFTLPSGPGQVFLAPSCQKAGYSVLSSLSWPAYLRSALTCGDFRYAGHATLNGQNVLVLDNAPSSGTTHESDRLWIDPETYLPIREVQQVVPGTPLGFAMPGDYDPITTDFSWLPPTQANIAKVSLPVPAGFHRTGNRKG